MLLKRLKPKEANFAWGFFSKHHYDYGTVRSEIADSSARYLVEENGKVVGFAAARNQRAKESFYCSHKIVALDESRWGDIADALAKFYVNSGHRYYCKAPTRLTAYRENNPEWRKVSMDGELTSWKYLGLNPTPTPEHP